MTSLGIIIFLILLNAVLFYVPFKVQFTNEIISNNVIKKIVWILAFVILVFVTTILATLAENAGLGITHELFVFQWIFLKALYVMMIFLFFNMIVSSMKLWKIKKDKVRDGGDDEE